MTGNGFIHPMIFFFLLALVLPFWKGRGWKWLLPLPGVLAIAAVLIMEDGTYGQLQYLGETLVPGRVDGLSKIFAHVFAIQALLGFVFALHVREKAQHIASALYVAGGFGCVFAGDYITLYIFWALMTVASTFIVLLARSPASGGAALRYFLFHVFGEILLLGGIMLRYHALGTFAFVPVQPETAFFYDYLILAGFCVNAAVVPLHAWLPDTYPRATVTGAVFMSAYTTKTAVYVLLRAYSGFEILAVAGTVMAVYGVFYATIENDARKILSYHIVSQVGYMVAGCGVGTYMAMDGAAAHAYAHILYKGLLFMSTGALLYAAGTARLNELGGLVRRLPWVFIFYMVAAVSISGVPFFSGFVTKNMTITGAAEAHHNWIALFLEVASVGTFLSVGLKLPYFAFYARQDDAARPLKPIPWNMNLAMAGAAALCFVIGVFPALLYRLLPFPAEYTPYTAWKVIQSMQFLSFTGLVFYLLVKKLAPEATINIDFDWVYRLAGKGVIRFCRSLPEPVDTFVGNLYRRVGLRAMNDGAAGSSRFDNAVIKGFVDGVAAFFRNFGKNAVVTLQTGRLQDYLTYSLLLGAAMVLMLWEFLY